MSAEQEAPDEGLFQTPAAPAPLRRTRRMSLRGDSVLGFLMVSPAIFYIVVLVAYPFLLSIYFSLSNATVAGGGELVGMANFGELLRDEVFRKALFNSVAFTSIAALGKAVLGIGLAFLLLQPLRAKKFVRIFLMLPWTMPLSLTLLGWKWVFDPQFSVINWGLRTVHLPTHDWLGDPLYTFIAILMVNIWRGFPFAAVTVLAGLTSIPGEILDAAKVDGAGILRSWHYVITPMIAPILFIGLVFDVTFTLGDLTIVYLLSNGGPGFSTAILPLESFHVGIIGGAIGRGAATAVFLFPFLLVGMVLMLRALYRRVDH